MESLVLFAKAPVPGLVKTRLAKERGARDAIILYAAFLRDTVATCAAWREQTVAADPNRRFVLYVDPYENDPIFTEAARISGARFLAQPEGDLGSKLRYV